MTEAPASSRGPAIGASETASWLISLLRPITPFAEAIVRRQAERAGIPMGSLSREDLPVLGPMILGAAQMFVDPSRLTVLRHQLEGR